MPKVKAQENKKDKWGGKTYRSLSIPERDTLFAFYEKHNGNMNAMIRDELCPFHSYTQIRFYAELHGFETKLDENRRKKAEQVIAKLGDAKIRAIENAMRILEPRHQFVFKRDGSQIFDVDGNPKIIETLPYYKELKAVWEIIKTEMGEPTTIGKTDLTSKGERITAIQVEVIRPQNATDDTREKTTS
jgi:hypothetical protein